MAKPMAGREDQHKGEGVGRLDDIVSDILVFPLAVLMGGFLYIVRVISDYIQGEKHGKK
jgi:hypothetical protein